MTLKISHIDYKTVEDAFIMGGGSMKRACITGATNSNEIRLRVSDRSFEFPVTSIPRLIQGLQEVYDVVKPAEILENPRQENG